MPTTLRTGPYRFYFYSYDGREVRHMHIDRESRSAKFWLHPCVVLATHHGYSRRELRDLERIISEHLETLIHAWDAFCGGDLHPA